MRVNGARRGPAVVHPGWPDWPDWPDWPLGVSFPPKLAKSIMHLPLLARCGALLLCFATAACLATLPRSTAQEIQVLPEAIELNGPAASATVLVQHKLENSLGKQATSAELSLADSAVAKREEAGSLPSRMEKRS